MVRHTVSYIRSPAIVDMRLASVPQVLPCFNDLSVAKDAADREFRRPSTPSLPSAAGLKLMCQTLESLITGTLTLSTHIMSGTPCEDTSHIRPSFSCWHLGIKRHALQQTACKPPSPPPPPAPPPSPHPKHPKAPAPIPSSPPSTVPYPTPQATQPFHKPPS